jgi:hypothetical protein
MLSFARAIVAFETKHLHPTLEQILRETADGLWQLHTGQEYVIVTDIYRTHEETIRIYSEAGLKPPVVSVHELGRGVDLSVRMATPGRTYQEWPFLPAKLIREYVSAVNRRWRYQESEEHQVALYHNVAGVHVHLQCRPGGETVRREVVVS